MSLLIAAAALYSRGAATVPADTAEPAMNAETTPDPEEQARQEALAAKRADALSRAQTLAQQYFYDEAIAALSDAELECDEIAAARGQTLAEMALAWLLSHEEITTVLIGASKTQQILDNIKAVQNTSFTAEELAEIDRISK